MTRRYDHNHRAVLEDQAGLSVVVFAHATSDQPARHRERVLARSERPVVHPRMPLVRAWPGAAARAGTKSSARLHAKHSHVTDFRKNRALVRRVRAMTLASREAAKPAAASGTGRGGRGYRFDTRLCQVGHVMRQHGRVVASRSLRGAPATPSPPRRSRRAAPGRSPKRPSRTRPGARDL